VTASDDSDFPTVMQWTGELSGNPRNGFSGFAPGWGAVRLTALPAQGTDDESSVESYVDSRNPLRGTLA
jgi:hypothetical protein